MPAGAKERLESRLPATDLRSLLLGVAGMRATRVRAAGLVAAWRRDRFVRPSSCDPRQVSAVEARLWQLLPEVFAGIELSPVAPLGSCAAVAPVSQNRILTTMRLTEVVADPTNALAIEAAVRRRGQARDGNVHLAAAHRVLRTQMFGPGVAAHFRLFALVSSARDTGSAHTELDLLRRHLAFWISVLETVPDHKPQIELTVFDQPVLAARIADTVLPATRNGPVQLVETPCRVRGRGYYTALALRLTADDGELEIGDGGFTNWTAELTSNAKERCLVSCIATEQLTRLIARNG
jgi:hypothetical protein